MTVNDRKRRSADLEGKRLTAFLLGLILVLAAVFVALEYNHSPADPFDDDEELLREMMAEGDAMPVMIHQEMQVLPQQEQPMEGEERIRVVPDEEEPEEEMPQEEETAVTDSLIAGVDSMAVEGDDMAPPPPVDIAKDDNPLHFRVVEDMPQFPGGQAEYVKWLTKNLRYPSSAQRMRVQGKVAITFIVERDGKITDVKVAQSLYSACDNEALRVMRMMPDWKPGRHKGEPCRTMVCVPIVFKL